VILRAFDDSLDAGKPSLASLKVEFVLLKAVTIHAHEGLPDHRHRGSELLAMVVTIDLYDPVEQRASTISTFKDAGLE
jgi:hypothetical protein